MGLKTILSAIAFLAILFDFQTLAQTHYETDAVTGATSSISEEESEKASDRLPDSDCGSSGKSGSKDRKGFFNRLTIGGYGEAVATYNMYSDNVHRYLNSSQNYDGSNKGHGRFDLPHVVIMLGYDFGKGWNLGMEIEFEHGGTEAAVEKEAEEGGEFEKEIERGGEVALEQFWIQKTFFPQLNIKAGHIIVPVGLTNSYHLPTQFFTVYRPEGENTIIPCTWHQTGLSIWGTAGKWRYEAMILPGLNSAFFNNSGWVHDGSASPYEFSPGNTLAGAFRVDNYSVKGLRMGLSGYAGNSFNNDIEKTTSERYAGVKGTVVIGAFDFEYNDHNFIARGSVDYGHLSDAAYITRSNQNSISGSNSPYPHTPVGQAAIAAGGEVGYDFFSLSPKLREQKFYVFGRYEYYNSYIPYQGATEYLWTEKQRIAVGINYMPIKEIVIKAEYSYRHIEGGYNPEPSLSLGVAFSGMFRH